MPPVRWTRILTLAAAAAMAVPAAAAAQEPEQQRACLPKGKGIEPQAIRGVHVGARASVRGPDGKPIKASSVSYCTRDGGELSFALDNNDDVVLVMTTSGDDMTGDPGAVGPGSPSWAARAVFPRMRRHYRSPKVAIYRTAPNSQVVLGLWDGEVRFVAVADRLLMDYRGRMAYYLKRLGW